jgi:hypothetical protein
VSRAHMALTFFWRAACKEGEHNSGIRKGSRVLCLLIYDGQALVSFVGASQVPLGARSGPTSHLTRSDYPHTVLMVGGGLVSALTRRGA